ncbi:MAG TPA: hypothetical protein VFI25_09210 [Planctomycetota bacterium]|nr:hypothetical protein [Planctomycetota bacterium]
MTAIPPPSALSRLSTQSVWALLALGCAHDPTRRVGAPSELPGACATGVPADADLLVSVERAEGPGGWRVWAQTAARGGEEGRTAFALKEEWGGVRDPGKSVGGVEAFAAGRRLRPIPPGTTARKPVPVARGPGEPLPRTARARELDAPGG